MPTPFVHLHVHSHYSLLRALPKLDELVKAAKGQGMDAVALTDYGAVYGVIEFIQECQKKEIKPIIGQCAYVALDKLTDKRPRIDDKSNQLVLLCETMEGYKNLLKLTTTAHLDGYYYKPRIDKDALRQHGKGLIGLSGGKHGEISKALAMDEFGKAEAIAREYEEIFGKGNFFLEVQDHPELDDTVARNRDLVKLSEATGIPYVATKDVHYLDPSEREAHDILTCIGEGKNRDDDRRTRMTDADYSFVSSEHMVAAFADLPEAIANTRRIADRCNVNLELGKWNFADIAIPEGETYDTQLRKDAFEGAVRRIGPMTSEMEERLEYELGIIKAKGYSPYFLVVSDYMRWAKSQGIITTTRGSAAGSLVSYAIDIVPVNPLIYKLPFERFLNPFRPSPPDIDGDFQDDRRDEVIAYVTEKYGKDHVAQIGTFGTMAARGSVRDVGRVLALPYALCDRISKMIPMGAQGFPMTIARAIEETAELREERDKDPQVAQLLDFAQKVEGSARHVSVHAAGVVIAPKPLTEYTALQKESGGEKLITQYEMNSIEAAGVLKSDFLGIRNLSIIGKAVAIIKRTKGVSVDIDNIPLDDARTYKMLSDGETTGTFQLNGTGMTRYLKELKPSSIHDIMAMVALFRPGPMDSIPEYIRRKHNHKLIKFADPRLATILDKSYGIMTYQDDVLLTAIQLAGYNWEEADKFRKAMGKKIPEEMAKQEEKFKKGCVAGGTTVTTANELWELIKPFAAYGFNKCARGDVKIVDPTTGDYRTIKELFDEGNVGGVATLDSSMKVVAGERLQVVQNGVKPLFELKTRSGRKIAVTDNHPLLSIVGWKRMDAFSVGDRIAVPRRLPVGVGAGGEILRWRVLGYLVAEGNLCHPYGVYFYSSQQSEISDFISAVAIAFGSPHTKVDRSKSAASVYIGRAADGSTNPVRAWLADFGLLGKKATEKALPDIVYRLNEAELSQLLAGLWQGDGCVSESQTGQIFYATSSEILAGQVQHLLLRLGVLSTIHEKSFAYRGTHKRGFTVNLSNADNVRRFADTVGALLLENKRSKLQRLIDRFDRAKPTIGGIAPGGTKDTVPGAVITDIRERMHALDISPTTMAMRTGFDQRLFVPDGKRVGYKRQILARIASVLDAEPLRVLATSDVCWDEIVSITPVGEEMTYDLEVHGTHNFVANDIVVHNSHACAYGMVAYQTSYLKANWPAEYMTAVLSAESGDTDKIAEVVADCSKMGMVVLPPDVQSSGTDFTFIDDNTIRFGLHAIKNLGSDTADAIIAEREANGAFESIADLASRIGSKSFNKKSLEALIKSGALDAIGERNEFLAGIDQILAYHKDAAKDAMSGQSNMFMGTVAEPKRAELKLRAVPPATKREKLAWERELLGLYVSEHPFKEYSDYLGAAINPIVGLAAFKGGKGLVAIGGVIMDVRQIFTKKKNEPMAFVKLEDLSGTAEVVVFPQPYKENHLALIKDNAVLVEGKIEERDGEIKVLAEKVTVLHHETLDQVRAMVARGKPTHGEKAAPSAASNEKQDMCIVVPATMPPSMATELKRIFAENPGSRRVYLLTKDKLAPKKIETSFSVAFSSDAIKAIESIVGRGAVQE